MSMRGCVESANGFMQLPREELMHFRVRRSGSCQNPQLFYARISSFLSFFAVRILFSLSILSLSSAALSFLLLSSPSRSRRASETGAYFLVPPQSSILKWLPHLLSVIVLCARAEAATLCALLRKSWSPEICDSSKISRAFSREISTAAQQISFYSVPIALVVS